jgi:hypothetical protein
VGMVDVIRSIEVNVQSLTTLFGNRDTGFAMLLPIAMVLGLKLNNIIWFNQFCLRIMKVGLFILPLSILDNMFLILSSYLLSFFLIPLTLFAYQSKNEKIVITLSSISLFVIGIYFNSRITVFQILFLWISVLSFHIYQKTKLKYLKNLVILSIVLFPFAIILSGFPFFEYLSQGENIEVSAESKIDTRTFLYTEVIADLQKNELMVFGKGALGTYYSPYFAQGVEGGDNENRLNVEVGFLSMLLKGGLINMILNFIILFLSVFLALKSKNKLTQRLSFLVICHILSLFLSDIPQYTTFSFSIWIAIGGCVSLAVRNKSENEILLIFRKSVYFRKGVNLKSKANKFIQGSL